MSSEEINIRANSVFEELYDAHGRPSQLDETFVNQYFVRFSEISGEQPSPEFYKSILHLIHGSSAPLVHAVVPSEHLKFVAADFQSGLPVVGSCKISGEIQVGAPYQF